MTKEIRLKELHIRNFRNISDKTYVFKSKVMEIAGLNALGKSNGIEAYNWLMTGSLLRNSSETKSIGIIPSYDDKLHVVVEGLFEIDGEEFIIRKENYNKFKTSILTNERIIDGATTEYTTGKPNGLVKHKTQKDALAEISKAFGYNIINDKILPPNLKSNIASFLVNPKWFLECLDSIEQRKILMSCCDGENISDEDILELNPTVAPIMKDYDDNMRDTGRLTLAICDEKKNLLSTKKDIDGAIKSFNDIRDVPTSELLKALNTIDCLNKSIYDIEEEKEVEDPRISMLVTSRQELMSELSKIVQSSHDDYNKSNSELQNSITELSDKTNNAMDKLNHASINKSNASNKIYNENREIEYIKATIESMTSRKTSLLEEYKKEKAKEFTFTGKTITCPHCSGEVQVGIEELKENFEKSKKERIDSLISKGKEQALEIENSNIKLEKAKLLIPTLEEELKVATDEYDQFQKELSSVKEQLEEKKKQLHPYIAPKEADELRSKIDAIDGQLREVKSSIKTISKKDRILEIKAQMIPHQKVIDNHTHFQMTQKDIEKKQAELQVVNNKLCDVEVRLTLCEELKKTILDIINKRLKTVIPDVDFVLVEPTIKEGGWNYVCYPLIKSNNGSARYINGSGRERATTAVKVQQSLIKYLGLSPLPLALDEGETMDINTKFDCDCQIILSKVDNNYKDLTLIDFYTQKEVI